MVDEKLEDIESLSQEELEKLEDELAAQEADGEQEQADSGKTGDDNSAQAKPPEGDGTPGESEAPKPGVEDGKQADEASPEELVKHVSPPSKWAKERQMRRELKQELEQVQEKAAKADVLETELTEVKSKLDLIMSAMEKQGVGIPTDTSTPDQAFSDERIEDLRDEYGDELADMMKAIAATIAQKSDAPAEDDSGQVPDGEGGGEPATPAQPDPDLLRAIDDNNELAYWRENSPPLWSKAVEKDKELLQDPGYQKLSYDERFKKVVKIVKEEITSAAAGKSGATRSGDDPPRTLTGSGGTVPPANDNSDVVTRVLGAGDADRQMEVYLSLSEAERDAVDRELGI